MLLELSKMLQKNLKFGSKTPGPWNKNEKLEKSGYHSTLAGDFKTQHEYLTTTTSNLNERDKPEG